VTSSDSPARVRRRMSARAVPVGRIAGVPVTVAPSWVLSVIVIGALGVPVIMNVIPGTPSWLAVAVSVLLGILLGASVLAHELGHCLAARLQGVTVTGVRLYLLGGVTELERVPRSPREEAVIAAAGPAVSGAIAGIAWLVAQLTESGTVPWLLIVLLSLSNVLVALFNVLPALPLDGGRVLRAGVWQVTGNRRRGTAAAVIGGYFIAVLLVGWAVALLIGDGYDALLPAGIAVLMASFVAVGAAAERGRRAPARWPTGVTLASLARPIAQLPAEVPVSLALEAAERRSVLLVGTDGVSAGLLDIPAARALVVDSPRAPSSLVARPVPPEAIVLADDDPGEVADRVRSVGVAFLLLIDATGQPSGVLSRADIVTATGRRARRQDRAAPPATDLPPPSPGGIRREKHV
jgi:Zn-dependent protease